MASPLLRLSKVSIVTLKALLSQSTLSQISINVITLKYISLDINPANLRIFRLIVITLKSIPQSE